MRCCCDVTLIVMLRKVFRKMFGTYFLFTEWYKKPYTKTSRNVDLIVYNSYATSIYYLRIFANTNHSNMLTYVTYHWPMLPICILRQQNLKSKEENIVKAQCTRHIDVWQAPNMPKGWNIIMLRNMTINHRKNSNWFCIIDYENKNNICMTSTSSPVSLNYLNKTMKTGVSIDTLL